MRKNILIILALTVILTSCGEYNKVLKSGDANYKFEFAKKAFEERKYVQAATLLEDVVKVLKGTDKAEESLYLLGLSYYENKDYLTASSYFKTYYTHYPKGKYTELAQCHFIYYTVPPGVFQVKPPLTDRNRPFFDELTKYTRNTASNAVLISQKFKSFV